MPIHDRLAHEAEQTGRTKAEIAREQISSRYIPQIIGEAPPTLQEQ
jgi:predicted DNA-binding protein